MDFFWHILALIGMSIPYVLGYNVVFGKGKIFHFGPLGVNVVIAYSIFVTLRMTGSYPLALLAGLLMMILASSFFSWLSLRLEPDGMGVMSIAVHLSVIAVILNWSSVTRGALGIPGIVRFPYLSTPMHFAIFSLLIAAFWMYIINRIDKHAYGRQLSALAEHEWHARALGVNRERVHLVAFLIAGLGGFLSVMLFPQYLTLLHPNDYHFPAFVFLVMIVVAGKPGSVWGVSLATVLLILLREGLRFVPMAPALVGPVRLILFGLILFVAVWIRRDSLFPKQRSV